MQGRPVEVRYLSGLDDDRLRVEYQRAHLLFLPLLDAWANNALLEAMSMGLPAVVTDLPAVREYGGGCAVYVTQDPLAIVNCICHLCDSPHALQELSTHCERRARELYSWSTIVDQYLLFYQECMS